MQDLSAINGACSIILENVFCKSQRNCSQCGGKMIENAETCCVAEKRCVEYVDYAGQIVAA